MNDQESKPTVGEVESAEKVPRPRGFAAMNPERVREIASMGGKRAHEAGTAHRFSAEEAKEAGRKGGRAPHASRGGRGRNTPPTIE